MSQHSVYSGLNVTMSVMLQDAYGNLQDYVAHQLDAAYLTIAGQQFAMPYAASAFSTVLNISTAGSYSLSVWLETPRSAPRQLLGSYTLTVHAAAPSAPATQVS